METASDHHYIEPRSESLQPVSIRSNMSNSAGKILQAEHSLQLYARILPSFKLVQSNAHETSAWQIFNGLSESFTCCCICPDRRCILINKETQDRRSSVQLP